MPTRLLSRRQLLRRAALGASALALAPLVGLDPRPATVRAAEPEPITVPIGEIVHETRADFAAGEAVGLELPRSGGGAGLLAGADGGTYTSTVLETSFAASHVGVHWVAEGDPRFELRTSQDGSRWSRWQTVLVEAGKDETPRGETFGALVGARLGFRLVQYRVTFPAGEPPTELLRVALTYLDARPRRRSESEGPSAAVGGLGVERLNSASSGPGARSSELARGLASVLAGPFDLRAQVVTREGWQADEGLRLAEDGSEVWPRAYVPPKKVVVHHTATTNDYTDGAAEVRAIYTYHAKTLGWGDIGYQFLIDTSGQIYEGRRGRDVDPEGRFARDVVSWGVVAGHVTGFNFGTSSIALIGNFEEMPLPPVMRSRLEEALAFECARSGIDPLETSDFLMQNDLWRDDVPGVPGHRDCTPIECPGQHVYAQLPDVRGVVSARLGVAERPRVGPVRIDHGRNPWPGRLSFSWPAGPGLRFSTLVEGWRRVPGGDEIVELSGYRGLSVPDAWSDWSTATSLSLEVPPERHGHYTLHVRALSARGVESPVWERATALVEPQVPVDNGEAAAHTEGEWLRTAGPRLYYGSDYAYTTPGPDRRFRWRLTAPRAGRYAVQATWPNLPNFSSAASFSILIDGRPAAEAEVDQTVAGATWQPLAEVSLTAGGVCEVVLSNAPDGNVAADAVRLLLIG